MTWFFSVETFWMSSLLYWNVIIMVGLGRNQFSLILPVIRWAFLMGNLCPTFLKDFHESFYGDFLPLFSVFCLSGMVNVVCPALIFLFSFKILLFIDKSFSYPSTDMNIFVFRFWSFLFPLYGMLPSSSFYCFILISIFPVSDFPQVSDVLGPSLKSEGTRNRWSEGLNLWVGHIGFGLASIWCGWPIWLGSLNVSIFS